MNVVQFSKIQRNDVVVGRRRDGERDVGMVGGDQMWPRSTESINLDISWFIVNS